MNGCDEIGIECLLQVLFELLRLVGALDGLGRIGSVPENNFVK